MKDKTHIFGGNNTAIVKKDRESIIGVFTHSERHGRGLSPDQFCLDRLMLLNSRHIIAAFTTRHIGEYGLPMTLFAGVARANLILDGRDMCTAERIERIALVTGRQRRSCFDYFDSSAVSFSMCSSFILGFTSFCTKNSASQLNIGLDQRPLPHCESPICRCSWRLGGGLAPLFIPFLNSSEKGERPTAHCRPSDYRPDGFLGFFPTLAVRSAKAFSARSRSSGPKSVLLLP